MKQDLRVLSVCQRGREGVRPGPGQVLESLVQLRFSVSPSSSSQSDDASLNVINFVCINTVQSS